MREIDYPSEYFMVRLTAYQAETVDRLHQWMMQTPQIRLEMKWKVPFYSRRKAICYLNPIGRGEVEWCFVRARYFSVDFAELETRGRKMVSGWRLGGQKKINMETVSLLWDVALEADSKA